MPPSRLRSKRGHSGGKNGQVRMTGSCQQAFILSVANRALLRAKLTPKSSPRASPIVRTNATQSNDDTRQFLAAHGQVLW